MQIVIDIDDNTYTHLFDSGMEIDTQVGEILLAVKNGKPLPKGHEALKDAGMIKRFLYSSAKFWGTWNLGKHRIFNAIDNVAAVIEADKEVDE